jgi:hypothetical protein
VRRDYFIIALSVIGISFLVFLPGRRRIIRFARSLVGQQEISGNLGFKSATLQRLMQQVGWMRGDQWCVYYTKLVWYQMAPDTLKPLILKKISGNSQDTFKAISEDKTGAFKVSRYPLPGDIVIWQYYESGVPQWKGHAGIVTGTETDEFYTTEGNTDVSGSTEGYIIADKTRQYAYNVNNGLRLKGFLRIV